MPLALLALLLPLSFVGLGISADDAQAATSCKRAYNACLARCLGRPARCVSRCRTQYRYCRFPLPYLGDLL
jgi:hypothetical protein